MKKYLSEIIGTFSMIFCGCGAMVINDFTGGTITHPGVAITWGLIVMTMIYAFGDISCKRNRFNMRVFYNRFA